jgi:hypothetical protein
LVPSMYRQRLQLIRTPWHHLSSYLLVSHRRSSNCLKRSFVDLSLLKPTSFERSVFLFSFAHKCANVQMCKCANVQMCKSKTSVQNHLHTIELPVPMPLPKTPPTEAQWAHIVGMLEGAHAGSPAAQSAWGQTEAKRDMGLRTNLYGATQGEDHAQAGVGAATPTSSSTACGRFCRGDSAAGPRFRSCSTRRATGVRSEDTGPCRRFPAAPGSAAGICGYLALPSLRLYLRLRTSLAT